MRYEDFGICGCPECSSDYLYDQVEEDSYVFDPPMSEEEWAVLEKEVEAGRYGR
jgi:uncharacterized Zn ribbon protein